MASPIVNVNVVADTKKFSSSMKSAGDDTSFITDGLKKVGIAAGIAFTAMAAGAVAFGGASLKAAAEAEAIGRGMENAAKNAGVFGSTAGEIDKATKALDDHSTKLAELTGIDDELFNSMKTGWLATPSLAALGTEGINNLAQVAADVAKGTGKDIGSIGLAFTKVAGDSETALSKLTRQGIVLEDSQKAVYEAMVANGDEAGAQAYLIETLGEKYKGAAEAAANPFERLKVIFENLMETVGTALLPAIETIVPVVADFINGLTAQPEFQAFLETLSSTFEQLIAAIMPLLPIVLDLITTLLPPIMEIIQALAPIVVKLVEAFIPLIEAVLPPLVDLIDAVLPIISILVDIFVMFIPYISKLITTFLPLVTSILPLLAGLLTTVSPLLQGLADGMVWLLENAVKPLIDGIGGLVGWLGDLFGFSGKSVKVNASAGLNANRPKLAQGGIVMPRPGGVPVTVAEAGQPEAVIPLNKLGSLGGGVTVNIQGNVGWSPEDLANIVSRKQRQAMALSGLNGIIGVR